MRPALPLCALALAACAAPSHDGPSVLLITVDTLRADRLGCYGFELDTSPEIDRLAESSVLFERALAGSSATAPSHASILSARFTREHSVGFRNGDTRLEGVPTLATLFRDAGYATAAFVGNAVLRRGRGFERGFDVYDDELPSPEANRRLTFERIAEDTAEKALEWIAGQRGRPFFLWVHYQDPHGPYTPPEPFRGRFALEPPEDESPLPLLSDNSGAGGIPAYQRLGALRHPTHYAARYAEEIFYADHWIGALVGAADSASAPREVVVMLTADHGESLGDGDTWFVHRTTTPEVAHVPMLLRAPGLEPGRRRELVHHVDVMPTLLELAGLPIPDGVSGVSLVPWLRGESTLPERVLYTDIGRELSAYVDAADGSRGSFLRVMGARGAWREEHESAELPLRWQRFAWSADGSWQRVPTGDFPTGPVSSYAGRAVPMQLTHDVRPRDLEQLRALGYTD